MRRPHPLDIDRINMGPTEFMRFETIERNLKKRTGPKLRLIFNYARGLSLCRADSERWKKGRTVRARAWLCRPYKIFYALLNGITPGILRPSSSHRNRNLSSSVETDLANSENKSRAVHSEAFETGWRKNSGVTIFTSNTARTRL